MITTSETPQQDNIAIKQQRWGARLKSAREAMRLSEKEAATWLHLKPNIITILENESFENAPPAIFLRGYLRSYARLLNFNEQEIDQALIQLNLAAPAASTIIPKLPQRQTHPINSSHHYMRWGTFLVIAILGGLVGMWWNTHPRYTAPSETSAKPSPVENTTSPATTTENTIPPASPAPTGSVPPITTDTQALPQSPLPNADNATPLLPPSVLTPPMAIDTPTESQSTMDNAITPTQQQSEPDQLEMAMPEPGLEATE